MTDWESLLLIASLILYKFSVDEESYSEWIELYERLRDCSASIENDHARRTIEHRLLDFESRMPL